MAKNDFQYGGWNYYTLQCGMISLGESTLQCGMWLWNHDSEFTKWQHPAMWYMALRWHAVEFARWQHHAMWHIAVGSWHWIRQVAVPRNVTGGFRMTCHGIRPYVRRIGILHLVSYLTISPQSTVILHQSAKFYPNRTTLSRKTNSSVVAKRPRDASGLSVCFVASIMQYLERNF